uniref:Uncharacterized protein n=1 Tax=Ditylenchus dipsaci TaxID=166011 RepID=A0A915EW64_9BILA
MPVKRWLEAKTESLVVAVSASYLILFPNSGDGANLNRKSEAKWDEIVAELNQRYQAFAHTKEQTKNKDRQRVSGGGASEVQQNTLFESTIVILDTYEREAQVGVVNEGELTDKSMCWRTKKVKSDLKTKSKDPEVGVTPAEAANPVADQNQSGGVKLDKHTRFREALLKSQDDQKTIAVGTLADIIYEPTKDDKKFFEAPGNPSVPPNTPKTMKTCSAKNTNQPVATNSKICVAVSKKPIEVTATEKPIEVTAMEELHPSANEPKTTKTAGTQIESKSKTKEQSKKVMQKVPNAKKLDKMTKSPATGTGLSVDTGGAQISTGGAEEPEVFENVQLGSSTMRVLEQKLAPNSAATNAQSGQLSVVGRDIIIGFPDNISDENENNGEKLYNANAAVTASGMVSHLIDEGAVGATAGNEDRRAISGRPDSRMAKKSQAKDGIGMKIR